MNDDYEFCTWILIWDDLMEGQREETEQEVHLVQEYTDCNEDEERVADMRLERKKNEWGKWNSKRNEK